MDARSPSWHDLADQAMSDAWDLTRAADPKGELDALATLAETDRPAALGEIQEQDGQFITDFMSVLSMTPGTRPNTYRVLHIATEVGTYAALYFKGQTGRPRPSQLLPGLMPPIPMPGHSSWPGGHATESWLMALCIEFVFQGVEMGSGDRDSLSANLRARALRIARNREVAGVHYKTDSDAGFLLAERIFPILETMGPGTHFGKAVAAARAEWAVEPLSAFSVRQA